ANHLLATAALLLRRLDGGGGRLERTIERALIAAAIAAPETIAARLIVGHGRRALLLRSKGTAVAAATSAEAGVAAIIYLRRSLRRCHRRRVEAVAAEIAPVAINARIAAGTAIAVEAIAIEIARAAIVVGHTVVIETGSSVSPVAIEIAASATGDGGI